MRYKVKYFVQKAFWRILVPKDLKIESDKKVFVFIGTPLHGNLGDQAISEATNRMLQSKNRLTFEVSCKDIPASIPYLKRNLNNDSILVLQGGGSFGDLYQREAEYRRVIIKNFPNNRIIVFPQSTFFENDDFLRKEVLFYKKYKNVVIAARDEKSYAFLKEKFENKIILSPDIVMSLEISNDNGANRKGVITLFRQDKEKSVSNELRVLIDEQVRQCYKDVEESDTVIEGEVSKKDRLIILQDLWNRLAQRELIITDRLHGMVFGYITKTPTLVLKNNNGKIGAAYESWLSSCNWVEYWNPATESLISARRKIMSKSINSESMHMTMASGYGNLVSLLESEGD
ncbi:polysaccharide pyruvyl transferase family protein [Weissella cibaria]|uniref:polysaccharide pyruvyl transferase family protein n=1 Tax=Weissella cibaria TaxID=137591 RepID=UPI001FF33FA0|nr:polysaccharide pyruvyl transferase family protein [Weissella cibaria]UOX37086.1 polysaccharide pyruvyl transferase family protein [Weissella cibaria]